MGSTAEHQALVNEILLQFGSKSKYRLWANNTGKAFRGKRLLSFGLVGSADITGVIKGSGRRIEIEVKTGKAVQSPDQINFMNMIRKFNGIYILARSVLDVELGLL